MIKNIENKLILSGGVVDLDKFIDSAYIKVEDDTILNALNLHNNMHLKIDVEKGCSLVVNLFDYAVELEVNLDIELSDETSLIINSSFIAEKKYELNIDTKLYGDNINASVNIRGINETEGTVKILLNGTVAGETEGNVINEYARIINKSRLSNVLIPNLVVNTNEVEANHGVSVDRIPEEKKIYLMSKGLSEYTALKMLEEGFILSIMPEDAKERIKNILVGR